MGPARDLEARENQDGRITHFGCSRCLWNVPYVRVNMFKSRFRPEEIAAMFFNAHDCEVHRVSGGQTPVHFRAEAKDAA